VFEIKEQKLKTRETKRQSNTTSMRGQTSCK